MLPLLLALLLPLLLPLLPPLLLLLPRLFPGGGVLVSVYWSKLPINYVHSCL